MSSNVQNLERPTGAASDLLEEEKLLERLKAGDERAFETLVREQTRRLIPLATRFLGSRDEALDAVQETLLAAFRSIESFRGEARISTWIRRIAVNQCLMILRRRKRHPEVAIESLLPGFDETGHLEVPCEKWESADDLLERNEMRALVRRLVEELPHAYREVLLLRDIEDLSTDEVASLLSVSQNTVKVRLHRARQALGALLAPHLQRTAA